VHLLSTVVVKIQVGGRQLMALFRDCPGKLVSDLDFTEARDNEWQWRQLGHIQVCTSLETDNHATIPPLKFFAGRMPFLPPSQQHQSTEGMLN